MLINAFGTNVYVENNVDISYFQPHEQSFRQELDELIFRSDYTSIPAGEQRGRALTTVHNPYNSVHTLWGFYPLMSCLYPYFLDARKLMTKKQGRLSIGRVWVNYMFKGCAGVSHTHDDANLDTELVGIFYLSAPVNSGNLVILETDTSGIYPDENIKSGQIHIPPLPNSLIIHNSTVNHAITEHLSDEVRKCIVIEMSIK